MKKLFISLLFTPVLFADVIGGIAITIDDEPITLYEIKQERAISNLSIKQTVNQLIRTKLEQIEAKKRNIDISNEDVLEDIKKVAAQNNMSLSQLYEAMNSSRNMSESQVKSKTREKLLKQKLFNAIAISQMEEPSESEVQEYYSLHFKEYQMPKSIDLVVYSSQDQNALQQKISNPMMNVASVTTEDKTIETSQINPQFASLLAQTDIAHFTPVLPNGQQNGYVSFYVLKKNEINTPSLEQIHDQIQNKIMDEKREQVLSEHFQRMRVNADIKILRLPQE